MVMAEEQKKKNALKQGISWVSVVAGGGKQPPFFEGKQRKEKAIKMKIKYCISNGYKNSTLLWCFPLIS